MRLIFYKISISLGALLILFFAFKGVQASLATSAERQPASESEIASPVSQPIPSLMDLQPMNGIDPRVADRYWEKWHLVTTRYRLDNNQTRIVYANDTAWNAMVHRLPKYPDGAMFAKAVFLSEKDPVFPASLIPKYYKEVELMKKDSVAYSSTGGWGFAIYEYRDLNAKIQNPPEEKAKELMVSCSSCHNIVKDHDFIFAQPAYLQWFRNDPQADQSLFESQFVLTDASQLTSFAKRILQHFEISKFKKFKVYSMLAFLTGERLALPSVAQFTKNTHLPHLVLGNNPPTFLLTLPDEKSKDCVKYVMTAQGSPKTVQTGTVCDETHVTVTAIDETFYLPQLTADDKIESTLLPATDYVPISRGSLPSFIEDQIPKQFDVFRLAPALISEAILQKKNLPQLRQILSVHAQTIGLPIVLLATERHKFVGIFPMPGSPACSNAGRSGNFLVTFENVTNPKKIKSDGLCFIGEK